MCSSEGNEEYIGPKYFKLDHAQDLIEVEQLKSISMKGVKREIKVFSVLNKLRQKNRVKDSSQKIKNVPERIGDRLDALETKIEEILDRLK